MYLPPELKNWQQQWCVWAWFQAPNGSAVISLLYLLFPNSMYSALLKVTDPYQSLPLLPNFSFSARLKGNRLRLQNKQPCLLLNHICNPDSSIFLSINSLPNLPFCSPGPPHSFRYILSSPSRLSLCHRFLIPAWIQLPDSKLVVLCCGSWSRAPTCLTQPWFPCLYTYTMPSPLFFLPGKQQAQVEKNPGCLF